jgi:hypothetical protein
MKKLKGGIESIVAVVILVGIVVALIIAVILPMTSKTREMADGGTERMSELTKEMKGE